MPQTLTVESQTPDRLDIALSWGRLVETPPADELVRLAAGEAFTIPAGHATSIRTKEGWQQGYAFTETVVTGPVDISKPTAMSRRDFGPANPSESSIIPPLTLFGGAGVIAVVMSMASNQSILAQFLVLIAGTFFVLAVMRVTITCLRKADAENGLDACAEASLKTFWREDLEWAQTQPIRAERAASDRALGA